VDLGLPRGERRLGCRRAREDPAASALPHGPVTTALLVVEGQHRTGGAQFVVPPAADTRDRHDRALPWCVLLLRAPG
jgi:hypothetical protein